MSCGKKEVHLQNEYQKQSCLRLLLPGISSTVKQHHSATRSRTGRDFRTSFCLVLKSLSPPLDYFIGCGLMTILLVKTDTNIQGQHNSFIGKKFKSQMFTFGILIWSVSRESRVIYLSLPKHFWFIHLLLSRV